MSDIEATSGAAEEKRVPHAHREHYLSQDMSPDAALHRIRTAGSISISPQVFEKIYLSPQNQVKGELRKTFANPTPM
jgi:hypothetical protein